MPTSISRKWMNIFAYLCITYLLAESNVIFSHLRTFTLFTLSLFIQNEENVELMLSFQISILQYLQYHIENATYKFSFVE